MRVTFKMFAGVKYSFFQRTQHNNKLVKAKQIGSIPKGHKRWSLKLIKHVADTGEDLLVFRYLPRVQRTAGP